MILVSQWADLSRIGKLLMVKKIPEMHIAFVALLEDLTEWPPSTYNFRREPGICEIVFSRAMKGCCKAFNSAEFDSRVFCLDGAQASDLV